MKLSRLINKNILLVIALILLVILLNSAMIVSEVQSVIIVEFGQPKRIIKTSGLHFKVPFIQRKVVFDKRLLNINGASIEVISADKKRLIVDAFMTYKVSDPLLVLQTTSNEMGAAVRLQSILESALRQVIGEFSMINALGEQRRDVMLQILERVQNEATNFGILVTDVKIKKIDLPDENSNAIYRRMKAERSREAREIRAQGESEAAKIRANADRRREEILANAYKKSQIVRGEADAKAIKLYSEAFSRDKEFYEFYRQMQIYREDVKDKEIILSDDGVFKMLK